MYIPLLSTAIVDPLWQNDPTPAGPTGMIDCPLKGAIAWGRCVRRHKQGECEGCDRWKEAEGAMKRHQQRYR